MTELGANPSPLTLTHTSRRATSSPTATFSSESEICNMCHISLRALVLSDVSSCLGYLSVEINISLRVPLTADMRVRRAQGVVIWGSNGSISISARKRTRQEGPDCWKTVSTSRVR